MRDQLVTCLHQESNLGSPGFNRLLYQLSYRDLLDGEGNTSGAVTRSCRISPVVTRPYDGHVAFPACPERDSNPQPSDPKSDVAAS
jgi:hypothetical protein